MAEQSKIEWLNGGNTASPWHGCARVHAGCQNCYAEAMAKRNPGTLGVWGTNGTRVRSASFADRCRKWNAQAAKEGVRKSVFPSICDPFEMWDGAILNAKGQIITRDVHYERLVIDDTPITMNDLRRDLFATIDACPHLDFILLTKRPQNVRKMWHQYGPPKVGTRLWLPVYRENVWLLTSISDQATADAMIPPLLGCRDLVPVLGLSAEPLLGPVDLASVGPLRWDVLHGWKPAHDGWPEGANTDRIDWVIVGGESGHGARPMHPAWVRSIREQCKAAGVPFFFKQWGEWLPQDHNPFQPAKYEFLNIDGRRQVGAEGIMTNIGWTGIGKVGKKAAGRLLDGREWNEMPKATVQA